MTRENIMEAMNGIGDHLIAEAAQKLGFLSDTPVTHKPKRRSAFSRFMNSGWGVAAVCALIAVSVMGGIIWAGQQPGVNPPIAVTEESDTVVNAVESEDESMKQTQETDTEAESETGIEIESEIESETETETETEPETCEHAFGDWQFTVTPTCTERGIRSRVCSVCDKVEDEDIPAGLHSFDGQVCTLCGEENTNMKFTSYGDGTCFLQDAGLVRGDMVIPNYSPEGDLVIAIGAKAFSGSFDSLVWPEKLTSIGARAFSRCTLPEGFTLPERIISIGENAFAGCKGLREILLPASLTYIGDYVFASSSVEKITFDEDLQLDAIPVGFAWASALKEITLPNSVTTIGEQAFSESLLVSCYLPTGVTTIGARAFEGCANMTELGIPESVTEIGDYAFSNCQNLTALRLHEGLDKLGVSVFQNFPSLSCQIYGGCKYLPIDDNPYALLIEAENTEITAVEFHPDMKMITGGAFKDCALLTEVTIPEGVEVIPNELFYNCQALITVNLPDTVTTIGEYAFYYCLALKEVPQSAGLMTIGEYAFAICLGLTEVNLPEGITEVGAHAFEGCRNLLNAKLPLGMTHVSDGLFYGCMMLREVSLPEGITHIGDQAFAWMDRNNASSLNIRIPKSVSYMGEQCFANSSVNARFDGTKAEWEAIEKGEGCFGGIGSSGVICTDGILFLNK